MLLQQRRLYGKAHVQPQREWVWKLVELRGAHLGRLGEELLQPDLA
jgi:hypothetical protein